jgi:hypothetical protein
MRSLSCLLAGLALSAGALAQPDTDGGNLVRLEGGGFVNEDTVRTARETMGHSFTLPEWKNPHGFEKDVFTFTRLIFWSNPSKPVERGAYGVGSFGGGGGPGRMGWVVDYPDADLNFSHRLQQLTSMKADPDARVLKLTSPELTNYPFVYMEHIERLTLRPGEITALRKYLQNGGVLLVNDFWGAMAWQNLQSEMKRVLPERAFVELKTDHPIFNSIYNLSGPMNRLRVPSMQRWNTDYNPNDLNSNPTASYRGEGYENMHVYAMFDDKQRIMVLVIHNSDISDGWEREGEYADYFKVFSEARAYPFGINIIFYLLTH